MKFNKIGMVYLLAVQAIFVHTSEVAVRCGKQPNSLFNQETDKNLRQLPAAVVDIVKSYGTDWWKAELAQGMYSVSEFSPRVPVVRSRKEDTYNRQHSFGEDLAISTGGAFVIGDEGNYFGSMPEASYAILDLTGTGKKVYLHGCDMLSGMRVPRSAACCFFEPSYQDGTITFVRRETLDADVREWAKTLRFGVVKKSFYEKYSKTVLRLTALAALVVATYSTQ